MCSRWSLSSHRFIPLVSTCKRAVYIWTEKDVSRQRTKGSSWKEKAMEEGCGEAPKWSSYSSKISLIENLTDRHLADRYTIIFTVTPNLLTACKTAEQYHWQDNIFRQHHRCMSVISVLKSCTCFPFIICAVSECGNVTILATHRPSCAGIMITWDFFTTLVEMC